MDPDVRPEPFLRPETIALELVSKLVDTEPTAFCDDTYLRTTTALAVAFFGDMPSRMTGPLHQRRYEDGGLSFTRHPAPYDVALHARPVYSLLVEGGVVNCPVFLLTFGSENDDFSERLLRSVRGRFFFHQCGDSIDSLFILGLRDEQAVGRGVHVIRRYLGPPTSIHARRSDGRNNLRFSYVIQ